MKILTQETENRQAMLQIEAEPEDMEKSLEGAYRRLVKRVNVPGFRRGKAPRFILERFIGKEALLEEAVESLLPQLYDQAIKQQGIEVFAPPQLEILQKDPLGFKAIIPLPPAVELGDYHQVRLSPEPVEVSEEQINKVMEQIREQHALWEPVERLANFGDLVTVDIEAGENPAKSYTGQQILVAQDSPTLLPGFAEKLVGMEKGQENSFQLSYPEDYEVKGLAGKQYPFKVKLTEVKEKHLPELDEEFAKSIGEGLETLAALRERINKDLKKLAEERGKRDFEQRVIQAVVDLSKVEFPPLLVEQEIDNFLSQQAVRFGGGKRGLENYLKFAGKSEGEARKELHDWATKRVAQSLVLGRIAEEKGMEVSDVEIDAEIEEIIKDVTKDKEELQKSFNSPGARQRVKEGLLTRKTVQYLVEIVSSSATQ